MADQARDWTEAIRREGEALSAALGSVEASQESNRVGVGSVYGSAGAEMQAESYREPSEAEVLTEALVSVEKAAKVERLTESAREALRSTASLLRLLQPAPALRRIGPVELPTPRPPDGVVVPQRQGPILTVAR